MGVDVAPGQGVTFPRGELDAKLGDACCRKVSTSRDFLAQPGRDLAGRGVWGVLGIQTQVGQPCADDAWMNCKDPDPLIPQLHRRDLNHPSVSRRARNRLTQSRGTAAFHWTRILPPLEDSNSMTHSSSVAGCGAISSTNAGLVGFC